MKKLGNPIIWIHHNCSEMTDEEVLMANQELGGWDWLDDPSESYAIPDYKSDMVTEGPGHV